MTTLRTDELVVPDRLGDELDGGAMEIPPVDRSWWSWSGVQGGLAAALLVRHARRFAGDLGVRSVHGSLLRPVRDGGLHLETEVMRRSASSVLARSVLRAGGAPSVLATTLLAGRSTPLHQPSSPPVVPAVAGCPDAGWDPGPVPFIRHLEVRMAGDVRPFDGGTDPVLRAWIRLVNPQFDAAETAMVLLDSMPPGLYALTTEPVPIPTAEFSVHFTDGLDRIGGHDGWSLIEVRTEQASDAWSVDSSSLWDSTGTLLALGRQTRRILRT